MQAGELIGIIKKLPSNCEVKIEVIAGIRSKEITHVVYYNSPDGITESLMLCNEQFGGKLPWASPVMKPPILNR